MQTTLGSYLSTRCWIARVINFLHHNTIDVRSTSCPTLHVVYISQFCNIFRLTLNDKLKSSRLARANIQLCPLYLVMLQRGAVIRLEWYPPDKRGTKVIPIPCMIKMAQPIVRTNRIRCVYTLWVSMNISRWVGAGDVLNNPNEHMLVRLCIHTMVLSLLDLWAFDIVLKMVRRGFII